MNLGEFIRSFLIKKPFFGAVIDPAGRVALGVFFAISGGKKLFVASRTLQMYETLARAGIPFPHSTTYFVSWGTASEL